MEDTQQSETTAQHVPVEVETKVTDVKVVETPVVSETDETLPVTE